MKLPDKDCLERMKLVLGIAWIVILTVGGILVVGYCWSEGFLPDAFTFGDAFLLVCVAFAFGAIVLIGTLFGGVGTLWFFVLMVWVGNKLRRRKASSEAELHEAVQGRFLFFMSLLIFVLFAVPAAMGKGPADIRMPATILFFFMIGFAMFCAGGMKKPWRDAEPIRKSILFGVAMCFAATVITRPALLNISMGTTGIRSEPSNLIVVNDEGHTKLIQAANRANFAVTFCRLETTGQWGTLDARAIWHGVGTISYVRLLDPKTEGKRAVLVSLKRDGLEVLKGENTRFNCV